MPHMKNICKYKNNSKVQSDPFKSIDINVYIYYIRNKQYYFMISDIELYVFIMMKSFILLSQWSVL